MAIWYTADTHFGHENIIRFCKRPFRSAGHMDDMLIASLWESVGPEDDLWILGDFAFGERAKDSAYVERIFLQLPGARHHLVVGNHDLAATLELPWDTVRHMVEIEDGRGVPNTLCHYPMITWNHARRGALQLFGHVHNQWQGSRNAVNVGVDQWNFCPVRIADIERRARKLAPNKHWGDVEHGAALEG